MIDIQCQLRGPLADVLARHAVRRKRDPCELFADIIEAIFTEDLVDAVLDDAMPSESRDDLHRGP